MVTPLVNQYTPIAITRQSVGTTLSILPDATALDAAPANAGALMAGYDNTNALQRNIRVDASGRLIVVTGAAGATAAFDSGAVDETLTTDTVRASVTALDGSQALNSRNQPVEGRGALAAQAYTLNRLFTDSVLRADDGVNYSAPGTRGAIAAQAYTLQRLLVDAAQRLDDGATYSVRAGRGALAAQAYTLMRGLSDAVVRGDDGTTYTAVSTRAATLAANMAGALFGLTANSRSGIFRNATSDWAFLYGDTPAVAGGTATTAVIAAYVNSILMGTDTTLQPIQSRGALAAQAYTLERLLVDGVVRGDDGATYSSVRAMSLNNLNGTAAGTFINLLTASFAFGPVPGGSVAQAVFADVPSSISGRSNTLPGSLYTAAVIVGTDTTGAAVLRTGEMRGALAAQAYTLQRLFVDGVVRGDDGATYTTISTRGNQATKNSLFPRAANALNVNAWSPVADQAVTATGLSGAGVTATLAAPGLSLRQYITRIQIIRFAAAALTAAATPVLVTTTGIPGTPTFSIDASAAAQGTTDKTDLDFTAKPIEASADNAAVTIVAPATGSVIWRINVWYYNG